MTAEEFDVVLHRFIESMQLPAALSRLSELAKRLSDAGANHLAQQALSCASASAGDDARLIAVLEAMATYVQTVESAPATVYTGTDTVTFGGGTGENNTSTGLTGLAWVTADTVVFGTIPYSPLTSDPPSYFFQVARNGLTPGDGFNFEVYNPNTPFGEDYDITWVAVVP